MKTIIRISVTHNAIKESRYMHYAVDSLLSSNIIRDIIHAHSKYKCVEVVENNRKNRKKCGNRVYTLEELLLHLTTLKYTIKINKVVNKIITEKVLLGSILLDGIQIVGPTCKYGYTFFHLISKTDGEVPNPEGVLELFRKKFCGEHYGELVLGKCGSNAPYPNSYYFIGTLKIIEEAVDDYKYKYVYKFYGKAEKVSKEFKEVEVELL